MRYTWSRIVSATFSHEISDYSVPSRAKTVPSSAFNLLFQRRPPDFSKVNRLDTREREAVVVAGRALLRPAEVVDDTGPEVVLCVVGVLPGAFLFLEGAGAEGRLKLSELTEKLDMPGRLSLGRFGVEALLADD